MKKGLLISLLKVVLLVAWTGAVVVAMQYLLGFLMISILGKENVVLPVWTAVYSALTYVVAFLVLFFLTPKVILELKNYKKDGKKKAGSQEKSKSKNQQADQISGGSLAIRFKYQLTDRTELGLRGLPTWTDIGLAPVGYIVSLVLAGILIAIFSLFPWFDAEEIQNLSFNTYIAGFDRVIAFVVLVIIAPVAEELIFRGWLYGKIRVALGDKLPKWWAIGVSIVLVSVLFAALHGQWNVGLTVFAMSVVVCALREITGTIYAGILVHMIRNCVAFFLLYVVGGAMW